MALVVSRLLSLSPRVREDGGRLVISTGLRARLLTLSLWTREVVTDPKRRRVTIRDRVAWFFTRSRVVKFDHVRAVSYGYADANSFGGWNLVRDAFDVYGVGLKLHGDRHNHRHLFRFAGDGGFVNDGPLPDWVYVADYALDAQGTQASESRVVVEVLAKMIGVGVEAG